jgi:hypothetical protein
MMAEFISDIGKVIQCMDMENFYGKMAKNMQVFMKEIRKKDLEYIIGQYQIKKSI